MEEGNRRAGICMLIRILFASEIFQTHRSIPCGVTPGLLTTRIMGAGTQMAVIREVMTKELVTIEAASSVAAAVTVMGMRGVGAVLVIEEGRVEGIFTERDLVRALSNDIGAASQMVGQWMTRDPVTVGPEASVEEALEIMLNGHFRHLPVMEGERLVGVVSIRDLSRATLRE